MQAIKPYLIICFTCVVILTGFFNAVAQQKIDFNTCKKCVVLADQGVNRVAILDLDQQKIVWEWVPKVAIKAADLKWFNYISDAKPVYGGKYILATASGGAVALIRIAEKKVVFYAYAGGNTHSADVLPDGNIVSASSHGNYLTVFRVDTLQKPEEVYKKNIPLPNGHNTVWDNKRKVLWTASNQWLKSFQYNFKFDKPDLILLDSVELPGTDAHDLFPSFDGKSLWFSNPKGLYQYDLKLKTIKKIPITYPDIKSVSTGPKGFPTIIIYAENTQKSWSTDRISSLNQSAVFKQADLKMYKARWFVPNKFSYPTDHQFHLKNP